MKIRNTKDSANANLSYLVFGKSKTGKTMLSTTTPSKQTLLINAENNLASIYGADVNVVDTPTWKDFLDTVKWLESLDQDKLPKWVFIDSITHITRVLLQLELSVTKDGRQAYGEIASKIPDIINRLKALPINLVCIAQQGQIKDEAQGNIYFGAEMAGKQLEQSLPYMFDAVLSTRTLEHEGLLYYMLQCKPSAQYDSVGIRTAFGTNSEDIKEYEVSNLEALHNKILSRGA